jgi:DNA methylase
MKPNAIDERGQSDDVRYLPEELIGKYTKPEEEIRLKSGRQDTGRKYIPRKPVTVGWEPDLPAIRRGIVLDPFCGTATSGEVALKLGCHFIGIELHEENAQIAEERMVSPFI